ncbi:MAG: DUF29 domain-containing protein [Alphaproteobacteria bacterium]|nr:DUF29 domain-containing protein [Alphaproteobacteria bacterium]
MTAQRKRAEPASRYDRDFYGWAVEQAALLRGGKLAEADIENIAEEIASLGRSEQHELINRLIVLLTHLLKWQFQPNLRGNSWRLTLKEQRARLERHLARNPSLRPSLNQAVTDAYAIAIVVAQRETGLAESTFPAACPYGMAQIFDPAFLPD